MDKISFDSLGISREILEAISKLGFEKPSEVQEKVIPVALQDRDIIVKAQTGSGKTAAFGIPLCERIEIENNLPQALVLTPTRELCVQVKEDISNLGRLKRVRCAAVFGKQPFEMQVRELKQRTHVVVGTPGRTLDHIERGSLNTEGIKYLIIDEADEMLNMGFIDQVEAVISRLPKDRITMLFSATMPEKIETLCQKYMVSPEKIEISPKEMTTERIEHVFYDVFEDGKFTLLNKLLIVENPDSCIIFCRTKENVDTLVNKLREKDYPCRGIHGGMLQEDRLEVMKKFKRGEFIFLVATDVAARGIDVENVTHIINYDVPMEKESYVHRIGRTGRAGRKGKAITLLTPYEYRFLEDIEAYIGFRIDKAHHPTEEEVKTSRRTFREKISAAPKLKKEKGSEINKGITKIYINAGKKKKMRPGDIVGAITSVEGVVSEDIGIIDVQDNISYVDILNNKGKLVLDALKNTTIKGKTVKVEKAQK